MEGVPIESLLAIFGCLVLSAFFSGSETALTSIPRARAQQMYEASGGSLSLRLLVEEPVAVLTTILIGNNVVNITASALATQVAEELLGGVGAPPALVSPVAVAVGAMTFLLLVFGEITPKALARSHAERLTPLALALLTPLVVLLRPVSRLFVAASGALSRMTGSPAGGHAAVREEDIEYLVELGRREGTLSPEREGLLRSVFAFTETTAREVMVPRPDVVAVPAGASEAEFVDLVVRFGHSRLPVYEGNVDGIIGVVHAKDLLRSRNGRRFDLRAVLRQPEFVPLGKPIAELLREMQERRVHMAVVVDEFGGTAGIVTLEDIMEELFGEIRDEHDIETDAIVSVGEGAWRVEGGTNLADLGDALGLHDVETEDCDTVGGLIAKITGDIGRVGTEIEAWGHRFIVEEADLRRTRWVRVERLDAAEAEPRQRADGGPQAR